ncbi:MAG: hypothetical protein RL499_801 [Actinomycetota bacterium]
MPLWGGAVGVDEEVAANLATPLDELIDGRGRHARNDQVVRAQSAQRTAPHTNDVPAHLGEHLVFAAIRPFSPAHVFVAIATDRVEFDRDRELGNDHVWPHLERPKEWRANAHCRRGEVNLESLGNESAQPTLGRRGRPRCPHAAKSLAGLNLGGRAQRPRGRRAKGHE